MSKKSSKKPDKPENKKQPGELSRREFLYIAGVFGMTPVVNGIDPLQVIQTKPKITAKPEEKVALKPVSLVISCLRPDDLLAVDFECINLAIKPGLPPKLVRQSATSPAYLVIHFPPQNIAEQAFFETTPDFTSAPGESASSETPPPPPVRSIISGKTRLAFLIPDSIKEIPLTLESLLSWEMYEPSLVPVAIPPLEPAKGGLISPDRSITTPTLKIATAPGQNLYQLRTQRITSNLTPAILSALKITPPASHQTAIEMPYRLILSPHALNIWRHSVEAVTRNGKTELWHTRLAVLNPDGTASESDNRRLAIRSVWSPDCDPNNPTKGPGHSNLPFRMSLDQQDRHEIVHLTSNFSLKLGTQAWTPKPININRLMLSSLGGWLDSEGVWSPSPLNVGGWKHKATLGRDHYVKVVYEGYLLPFGHGASLIKITERKFRKGTDGQNIAYLFQRMYIVVRKPEKNFPAPYQPDDARDLPFRRILITSLMTPPIDPPEKSELFSKAGQTAFWPRVAGRDFKFHCIATDWAGKEAEVEMPMAFVEKLVAFDPLKIQSAIGTYNQKSELPRRRISFFGQNIAFAQQDRRGDTSLEVDNITFATRFAGSQRKPPEFVDVDQPLFYPQMQEAAVFIPALKNFVQFGSVQIVYPSTYINTGFASANKGQIFAALPQAPRLDFGGKGAADKAGGMATPSFSIVGLSRVLGPVGGTLPASGGAGGQSSEETAIVSVRGGPGTELIVPDDITQADEVKAEAIKAAEEALKDIVGGKFDPSKFFDDKAKLLGGLLLKDLIAAVENVAQYSDKALTIKTDIIEDKYKLPTEVQTSLQWKPDLKDILIFIASRGSTKATLTIDAKSIVYLNGKDPYYELKGELKDFTLDLIKPIMTFIKISFEKFSFKAQKGKKTDFDPKIAKIEFAGPLNFIKKLLDKISLPGSGGGETAAGDGPGSLGKPIIDVDASRARLGYIFNIPDVAFGVFTLQNIKFTAEVTLPFNGDPLSFRFAFNEKHNPFLLTVAMFGGGGFFAMVLTTNGIKLIEGSLEFGGSFSMNLGVASGGVTLMAGIYFKYEDNAITITGYVRCSGCLDVLGIISISAEFYLALTYEQATNRVWGQASLTVKIKILFFSAKVTLKVERTFSHSPAPLFADMMDENHWLSYCEAFA